MSDTPARKIVSEPMTPEREAKLRRYRSFSDAEMAEVWGEVDRLRASQAAQELRMNGMKVESDLDYHSMREFQAKFITASQLVSALAEKCDSRDARVKELEEALRKMLTCVAEECQCHDGFKCRELIDPDCTFCNNKDEILGARKALDRHASPNQDDVAEQSREFMGGTK